MNVVSDRASKTRMNEKCSLKGRYINEWTPGSQIKAIGWDVPSKKARKAV